MIERQYSRFTALLLATLCLLVSCQPPPRPHKQESYVFGTRVEILVAEPDAARAEAAAAEVLREFDRLHRAYHAWKRPSQLTDLNDALAAGRTQEVSSELAGFLREAEALARVSDYRFDPGIGRLIRLWGFQNDEFTPRLPDPQALAAWRAHPASIADLVIEPLPDGKARVSSKNREVALDFGGYLKGVALDRAAELLKQRGATHALINIGGNVLALGDKFGTPWKVGIQHPRQPGPLATLELQDGEAIGTSGDYQRYFELDGKRYSHLLDPRTGEPVQGTEAVTLLMPPGPHAGTRSDALSKPLFIAGKAGWQAAARAAGVTLALRVDASGEVDVTPALKARLVFLGDAAAGPP